MNKKDISIVFLIVLMIAGLMLAHTPKSFGGMAALFCFSLVARLLRDRVALELMWFGAMTPVFFAVCHLQATYGPETASWDGKLSGTTALCVEAIFLTAALVFFLVGLQKYLGEKSEVRKAV